MNLYHIGSKAPSQDFEEVLKCVENLFYWDNKTPGYQALVLRD